MPKAEDLPPTTASPEVQGRPATHLEGETGVLTPWTVLQAAVRAVPALRYALAVLGVVSVIAIVKGYGIDLRLAVFGTIVIVVLMAALVVFAALTKVRSPQVRAAALVMMWSSLAVTILSAALLFTATFFSYPKPLADLFGLTESSKEPRLLGSPEMRDHWRRALAKLMPLLQFNQNRLGGFGSELGKPDDYPDAWTGAQAIAGLSTVGGNVETTRSIRAAVQWLAGQKKNDGWVSYHHRKNEPVSTEVTAWAGIAYELALDANVFSDKSEREVNTNELRKIYAMISNRQNEKGAWSSWPLGGFDRDKPYRSRGGYATAMATKFFLGLNEPRYVDAIGDGSGLRNRTGKAVSWIMSEYNAEIRGWEHWHAEGLNEGLTMMYLSVLTEAKRRRVSQIEPDRRYRGARTAWLVRWKREVERRDISENYELRQKQETADQDGRYDHFDFPVRILWYPNCLLLVEYLLSDGDLPREEKADARVIQQHLWSRLPKVVDEMTVGETFRVAELVLALGVVGRNNGWSAR